MPVDPEKLAKLNKIPSRKVGGSRVKTKKNNKFDSDDTKLMEELKKLNSKRIEEVSEANFFMNNGKVIHFNRVSVQKTDSENILAFTGIPREKNISELIPQILPQLGVENLEFLKQMAQKLQNNKNSKSMDTAEFDNEIPELIDDQNFNDIE